MNLHPGVGIGFGNLCASQRLCCEQLCSSSVFPTALVSAARIRLIHIDALYFMHADTVSSQSPWMQSWSVSARPEKRN